jgi:hypothetical protein
MTFGTMILMGLTASLVLLKLGLMAFALGLVAKALFQPAPVPVPVRPARLNNWRSG